MRVVHELEKAAATGDRAEESCVPQPGGRQRLWRKRAAGTESGEQDAPQRPGCRGEEGSGGGAPILVRVPPGALTRRSPCSRAGDDRCPGDFAQPCQRGRQRVAAPPGSAAERSVGRSSPEPLLSSGAQCSRSQPSPKGSWALLAGRRAARRSRWAGPETWGAGAGRPQSSPGAPRPSAPGLACCLPAPPSGVAPPQGRPRPPNARGGRCSLAPALRGHWLLEGRADPPQNFWATAEPPYWIPSSQRPIWASLRPRFFGEEVCCRGKGTERRKPYFSCALD